MYFQGKEYELKVFHEKIYIYLFLCLFCLLYIDKAIILITIATVILLNIAYEYFFKKENIISIKHIHKDIWLGTTSSNTKIIFKIVRNQSFYAYFLYLVIIRLETKKTKLLILSKKQLGICKFKQFSVYMKHNIF